MRLRKLLFALLCLMAISAQAQWRWHDPLKQEFNTIQNQGWQEELGSGYARLPIKAKGMVRQSVWNLSRNSSGLAIHFYSDAPELRVRYVVEGNLSMPHMPATGVSGVDLYSIDSDGKWQYHYGGLPSGDTIQLHYKNIGKDRHHAMGFEYRLYLPLYNSVKWLEIGTPGNSELRFIPTSTEKPIVIYGTSIAQGACASRPGMAWGTILQRSMDYPVINLGFSGNGKLEREVLSLINEIDARIYILDCLPNLTDLDANQVERLVIEAVRQIRTAHETPILLVEHIGYSDAPGDKSQLDKYMAVNRGSRSGYDKLTKEGVKGLYYISREELDLSEEAWVDYIHPSDLGMKEQAEAIERRVREILRIPVGDMETTRPVTQRREPHNYEWRQRHDDILALNRSCPPRKVIMGNSITHFWGGEPKGPSQRGLKTWEKIMRPAGFHNMGYGWDRIENLLWRVHHGELDGFSAEEVVLMIGTNNIGISSDDEIVEGLRFLIEAVREKQPRAKVKVIGILPRRGAEGHVKLLNQRIRQMVETSWLTFKDPGINLLLRSGKIDETLFSDGLHPNEEGYKRIVDEIVN